MPLRTRYLTCFYCGRRTSTRWDRSIRRFDCPSCEATNYLDENGDITDPPVATDTEATPKRLAIARPSSPMGSPTSERIFCDTCLKNQHLLSASLAQYLPDPDEPDYAEREASLAEFRAAQERLYPQICPECEPKVRARLGRAEYTAKTDALRRMVDRSAAVRKEVMSRRWLEMPHALGKRLREIGFVLQLVWHAAVMNGLLLAYLVWAGLGEGVFTMRVLRVFARVLGWLPAPERLLSWSVWSGVMGVWWNPRFAHTMQGFTKPVEGVPMWYICQVVAIGLRVWLQRLELLALADPFLINKQFLVHMAAVLIAILIFILSPRTIHPSKAPLFGNTKPRRPNKLHKSPPRRRAGTRKAQPRGVDTRPDELKSMAELLDEISRSPTSTNNPPSPVEMSPAISRTRPQPPMGHAHTLAAQNITASLQRIDSLNISRSSPGTNSSPFVNGDYGSGSDEMDWTPTPSTSFISPYRAFNTRDQRPAQPFGAAPTNPDSGKPFWYRVPPAPTTPAQRAFNPPNQPRLRPSPIDKEEQGKRMIRFRGADGTVLARDVNGGGDNNKNGEGDVKFAEPSFFAENVVRREDPRDGLTGLFEGSFRLEEKEEKSGGWLRRIGWGGGEKRE